MKPAPGPCLALLAIALLVGCATTPKSCAYGIDKKEFGSFLISLSDLSRATVDQLQCHGELGDRNSMVELGRRYEQGDGVPLDIGRAVSLYRRAATDVPSNTAIYSPPVRRGGSGQMMFLANPNAGPGVASAKFRLGLLYLAGNGVDRNETEGLRLITTAADMGHIDAQSYLSTLVPRRSPDIEPE